jgi:hypothetical protein
MKLKDQWRRMAFEWGAHDCILAVCNHVRDMTGIDPAAPWRGSYSDEAGAQRIIAQHGDIWRLFRHGMARAGFEPGQPVDGAAVICGIFGKQIAGVVMGPRVGFVDFRGLSEVRAPILEAWPICRR